MAEKIKIKKSSWKDERGISPIISSILLVAMVLVIAIILFLWLRGLTQEAVVKFDKNIELVCEDVVFSASYTGDGKLQIVNSGNVPIWDIKLKISNKDTKSSSTEDMSGIISLPTNGLLQAGKAGNYDIRSVINGNIDKIIVIPILRGSTETEEKNYVCNDRFGKEIAV